MVVDGMLHRVMAVLLMTASLQSVAQTFAGGPETTRPEYRIGITITPPLSDLDLQGEPVGMIVDLLNEIARLNDFSIDWIQDEWQNNVDHIRTAELDMITSVGVTEERAEFMDFSNSSFITVWSQVFLPISSDVENFFDLDGLRIGVLKGGVNGARLRVQCEEFEIECRIIELKDYDEVFANVDSGAVDAGVSNNLVGTAYLQQYDILSSSIVFNPFKVHVAVPSGRNPVLLAQFDAAMTAWKADPESFYYQTRLKWLKPLTNGVLSGYIRYLILGLLAFALTSMIFVVLLKRQVTRRVMELSGREQQINQIINLVPHMIYVADQQGRVILGNRTASRFFGMSIREFENSNINRIGQDNPEFRSLVKEPTAQPDDQTSATEASHSEIQSRDAHGETHSLFLSKVPYTGRANDEPATVTVAVDITDAKKFEDKIRFMAQHDSLTGLPNRLMLSERINQFLTQTKAHEHCGAILFIDLDHFKQINDSQGHRTGDLLIKEVANRLLDSVRMTDVIARLGGDEFIVVLPELDSDPDHAESLAVDTARGLLGGIGQPFRINGSTYHVGASIGIVVYPRDGDHQDVLLQRADTAMYDAKANGRNRVQVFSQRLESIVVQRHELESELRLALLNNELKVVLQPVVEGPEARVIGGEALLRWHHPQRGVILPSEFIDIAEQKHLIIEIGHWVLEQVCMQIRHWLDAGKVDFFISVNLSVVQLTDPEFHRSLDTLIRHYQIPANTLELEVTESVLMTETMRATETCDALKRLGVRISIDDFGTGYSSFNYLIRLPLDKIKIDQSFIRNLPEDTNSATVVTTILRMARELNMDVVAEGIEQSAQFDFLLAQSCSMFQGFYFHQPGEPHRLCDLLGSRRGTGPLLAESPTPFEQQ